MLLLIILCVLMFCLGFVSGYRHRNGQADSLKFAPSLQTRVAAHEVGHAIVVWRSPHARISFIEMDRGPAIGNGRVRLNIFQSNHVASLWWDLAITLGGLVGELIEMKKFRSANCMSDLEHVRDLLRTINQRGTLTPPWKPVAPMGSFDVTSLFREGALSSSERAILQQAYMKTRWIIEHDRDRFDLLVYHLIKKGRLDAVDVENLLR